jgi:hypothetical protein
MQPEVAALQADYSHPDGNGESDRVEWTAYRVQPALGHRAEGKPF